MSSIPFVMWQEIQRKIGQTLLDGYVMSSNSRMENPTIIQGYTDYLGKRYEYSCVINEDIKTGGLVSTLTITKR